MILKIISYDYSVFIIGAVLAWIVLDINGNHLALCFFMDIHTSTKIFKNRCFNLNKVTHLN